MMEKKKEKYAFEFQEFMAINQIKNKDLPKFLGKMVKSINKLERKASRDCTAAHYKIIKQQLRQFANEVEDELYRIYDEKLKHNQYEELEREELETTSLEKELNEYFNKHETDTITSIELIQIGADLNKVGFDRFITEGEIKLRRLLGSDVWQLTSGKGGEDV